MTGFWVFDSEGERVVFVTEFAVREASEVTDAWDICGKTTDNEWVALACYPGRTEAIEGIGLFGVRLGALSVA